MRGFGLSGTNKIMAGIMVVMLLVVVLFSTFFIASEIDHDCCGDDCPICTFIHQCENTIRGISGTVLYPFAFVSILVILVTAPASAAAVSTDTLVSIKVRMDN